MTREEKIEKLNNYWFVDKNPDYRSNGMFFGYQCGSGWLDLLLELFEKLDRLIVNKYPDIKTSGDFFIVQVKEKYAELRVYTTYENDEIFDLIDSYCKKSRTICEGCGTKIKEARIYGSWYYALCYNCFNEMIEERESILYKK